MEDYDFIVKAKIFSLSFDRKFNIFDNKDKLLGVCAHKAFKLKEDIRVYSDEAQTKEIIKIKAQAIIDFSATYDVYDATNNIIGYWKRNGVKSILKDSWVMLDRISKKEIAKMEEDNQTLAFVRRFIPFGNLIPQTYYLRNNSGTVLATFIQTFNPFFYGLKVKVYKKQDAPDLKMAIAGAMLLATIEGKQQ